MDSYVCCSSTQLDYTHRTFWFWFFGFGIRNETPTSSTCPAPRRSANTMYHTARQQFPTHEPHSKFTTHDIHADMGDFGDRGAERRRRYIYEGYSSTTATQQSPIGLFGFGFWFRNPE